VLGFGEGGTGNHEMVGYDGLTTVLREITAEALRTAGLSPDQVAGAGFGVAGYDWPSELPATQAAIAGLGLLCPIEVVNDTLIGLAAGAEQGWGVAVVAGTSNNCWGWDREHRIGRMIGHGPRFGENGGASELVGRAVAAVAKAWTQRGPATLLTERFVSYAGAKDAADLLEGLSQESYKIGAEAAPVVFEVAQAGDTVGIDVIRWAGVELGSLAVGVIRQLRLEGATFEVVLVGSLYQGGPLLLEPMRETILAVAPGARLVALTAPPVVGAVLLGMQRAGLEAGSIRCDLLASTRAYVGERWSLGALDASLRSV
jgi:N-acetylglucosamine kinase-like BadF-type ATPase